MWKYLVVMIMFKSACGAIFDPLDIDDPLALFWHTNEYTTTKKTSTCTVKGIDGIIKNGVCQYRSQCLLSGGIPNYISSTFRQECGVFATCCTHEYTCGAVSRTKVSYFQYISPTETSDRANCDYRIELVNHNVCQIRLDFEEFHLTKVSRVPADSPTSRRVCMTDIMTIRPNYYNIPPLCGNNHGQHASSGANLLEIKDYGGLKSTTVVEGNIDQTIKKAIAERLILASSRVRIASSTSPQEWAANTAEIVYIHLAEHDRSVTIDTSLAKRGLTGQKASWRIKVTQLECPGYRSFLSKQKDPDYAITDFNLLAPLGSVQYFSADNGIIKSFGFDSITQDSYTSNQFYTIAFKKDLRHCKVRFTTRYFNLYNPSTSVSDGVCADYLFVPELTGDLTNFIAKVCSSIPAGLVFESQPPGPLFLHFRSAEEQGSDPYGFYLEYELYC